MDTPAHTPFDEAVDAARGLPAEQQEALAAELLERIDEFKRSALSGADSAEVAHRLAEPALYADDEKVRAFFARHGVAA